jgi:hypothetical protein
MVGVAESVQTAMIKNDPSETYLMSAFGRSIWLRML